MHGALILLTVAHGFPAGDTAPATPTASAHHRLSESARERWLDDGGAPRLSADLRDQGQGL
ncbi:MAG: hypothetical protein ABI625_21855 [bacterium]